MRIAALTVCLLGLGLSLGLTGCAGTNAAGDSSALAVAEPPPPAASVAEPTPPGGKPRRAHTAARGTSAPPQPAPTADAADDGPMTHAKASARCWMKYEDGKINVTLDKRADLVNQCVTDTMKAAR